MATSARWLMCVALSAVAAGADASPFMTTDARSAAMGGVGVASGVKAAPLTNPALLAYGVEFVDWFLTIPAYSEITSDPKDMGKQLEEIRAASTSQAATRALNKFADSRRIANTSAAFFATIPSNIIGAGVFFNAYEFRSLRANLGAFDVSDPANPVYNSTVEKRGLSVIEHGASLAQVFTTEYRGFDTFALGISPKIVLWQAVNSSEDLTGADTKIGFGGSRDGSSFNFDVGMFKELGRFYSGGLFIRNLFPMKVRYPGASGVTDEINTQVRAGIAYERRSRVFEMDLDLVPNTGVGFENKSQILSLGGEFALTQQLFLRAGLRQNLLGDAESLVTFGVGFGLDYVLDLAVAGGYDELATTAQFSMAF